MYWRFLVVGGTLMNKNVKIENINLNDKDYLLNKIYSDELLEKINSYFESNEKNPLYIGIIGTWGSGKSTIVNTTLSCLDEDVKKFVYDAWKYEDDSFRRTFINALLNQSGINRLSPHYKEIKDSLYEDYSISSNSIIERIKLSKEKDKKYNTLKDYILAFIIIVLVILSGFIVAENYNSILGMLFSLLGTIGLFNVLYSTTTYSKSKLFSPEQFYSAFIKIITNSKCKKNIIFIDNLDRCDSETLMLTLKSIKGFYLDEEDIKNFKGEKVVFIIPLDINSINKAYKEENYEYYIDKIFDELIYLKLATNTDKMDFINNILNEYNELQEYFPFSVRNIVAISNINTPREIIRIINSYMNEYSIILKKNGTEFISKENNREYLMKNVIINKKYPKLEELAYTNLYEFTAILTNVITSEREKEINRIYGDGCVNFLKITKDIKPSNYFEFYFNQKNKKYSIPQKVEQDILAGTFKSINEVDKAQIVNYFKESIYWDVQYHLWKINIKNKFNSLIQLYRKDFFSDDDVKNILLKWNEFLLINEDFYNELIYSNDIKFEDLLFFNRINTNKNYMYKKIISGLIKNMFKYSEEDIFEKTSILFNEEYVEFSEQEEIEYLNKHILKVISKQLVNEERYNKIIRTNSIIYISPDNIKKIINNIRNVEDFIKIIDSINKYNYIYNSDIKDIIIQNINSKCSNILQFEEVKKILEIVFNWDNYETWISKLNISFNFTEIECCGFIEFFMKKYIKANLITNTFKYFVNRFKNIKNIEIIFENIGCYKAESKDIFVEEFTRYIDNASIEIIKNNINNIVKFYFNNNAKPEIINILKNKNILELFYESIEDPNDKEEFIIKTIDIIKTKDDIINNLFLYESSQSNFENIIVEEKEINNITKIASKCKKKFSINRVSDKLYEIISSKDNITNEEFDNIYELLLTSKLNKIQEKKIIICMIDKTSQTNLIKIKNNIEITDQKIIRMLENSIEKENSEMVAV